MKYVALTGQGNAATGQQVRAAARVTAAMRASTVAKRGQGNAAMWAKIVAQGNAAMRAEIVARGHVAIADVATVSIANIVSVEAANPAFAKLGLMQSCSSVIKCPILHGYRSPTDVQVLSVTVQCYVQV